MAEQKASPVVAAGKSHAEAILFSLLLYSSFCISALRDEALRDSKSVNTRQKTDKKIELAQNSNF